MKVQTLVLHTLMLITLEGVVQVDVGVDAAQGHASLRVMS